MLRRSMMWTYYVGLSVLLILVVGNLLVELIPRGVAGKIGLNSEGYLFALGLAAWIQFGLPRLSPPQRVKWGFGVGIFWALAGAWLLSSDLPTKVVTLNEAAFGLAVVVPYVSLRRPLPKAWVYGGVAILMALTVWGIWWAPESWVIGQAETFGFVILAMLTFDVFDRVLLNSGAEVTPWLRWLWYIFMILEPIVVSGLGTGLRDGDGSLALILEYLGRIHESFIGVLLVALILHISSHYRSALQSEPVARQARVPAAG